MLMLIGCMNVRVLMNLVVKVCASSRERKSSLAREEEQGLALCLRLVREMVVLPVGVANGSERPACGASRVISGSSVTLGLGGGFLPLSHSANRRLGLSMHRSYLVLTAFLGQLLGKCWLLIKASIFSPGSPQQPHQGLLANGS